MVNNSTNINKTNNHLNSPQITEHKRDHHRSWLRTGTKMWQCETIEWDPNPSPVDYWIFKDMFPLERKTVRKKMC